MKKSIIFLITFSLCYIFGNAQTTITNGANSVTLDAVAPQAAGVDLTVQGNGGQGRTRLLVIPKTGDDRSFIEALNSSDVDNAGKLRLGARDKFGVLATLNQGTPSQKITSFAIELDATDVESDEAFIITSGGYVGTTFGNVETVLCKVDGNGLSTIEAKVQATVAAPDYVFKNDYNLRSLDEVEAFINKNSHLPEIPSAAEFEKNGIELGKMSFDLLKKVEELTLYMIELKKENENLKSRLEKLEK